MVPARPGFARQSDYRESLIESIRSKPSHIFGAEVCQVCGQLETYTNWIGAMATHRFRRYACWGCFRRFGEAEVKRILAARSTGCCEVCLAPGARAADCRQFLCEGCRRAIARSRPDGDVRAGLRELSRRRYLEGRSTEALEALDFNSEVDVLRGREADEREQSCRERIEGLARRALAERHQEHL